jgi:hypothetical protein
MEQKVDFCVNAVLKKTTCVLVNGFRVLTGPLHSAVSVCFSVHILWSLQGSTYSHT